MMTFFRLYDSVMSSAILFFTLYTYLNLSMLFSNISTSLFETSHNLSLLHSSAFKYDSLNSSLFSMILFFCSLIYKIMLVSYRVLFLVWILIRKNWDKQSSSYRDSDCIVDQCLCDFRFSTRFLIMSSLEFLCTSTLFVDSLITAIENHAIISIVSRLQSEFSLINSLFFFTL